MLKRFVWLSVALLCLAGPLSAGEISWLFQQTDLGMGGDGVALGMRGGNVWPVIFSDHETAALYPSGWHEVGYGLVGPYPRAASSPTGEVAAWNPGGGVVSTPSGWEVVVDPLSMAFDSQGRLYKADQDGISYRDSGYWYDLPDLGMGYNMIDIAVAGNGDVGAVVLGPGLRYCHYSQFLGGWQISDDLNDGWPNIDENPMLVFDAHDVPHIVGGGNGEAVAMDFDVRTGTWNGTVLPFGYDAGDRVLPLAASPDGTVGTAYVMNDTLYYARKELDGAWMASSLPTSGSPNYPGVGPMPDQRGVGLEYDWQGIPVIAYASGGQMILAYDPIQTPEPATLALLACGGLALLRRQKR